MTDAADRIIYTHTDEAPLLATYSFLPIIQAYAAKAGVDVETRDISLAGRILAVSPTGSPRSSEAAGRATMPSPSSASWRSSPEANIIKLPNISASIPQLKAAIAELQEPGLRRSRLPR